MFSNSKMRRYSRALLLCTVFAVCSGLYVYNKLLYSDVSLVGNNGPRRASGAAAERRGAAENSGPRNIHWYNRYVKTSSIELLHLELLSGHNKVHFIQTKVQHM